MSKLAESSSTARRFESQWSESSRGQTRPTRSQTSPPPVNDWATGWMAVHVAHGVPMDFHLFRGELLAERLSLPFRYWPPTTTEKLRWMERRIAPCQCFQAVSEPAPTGWLFPQREREISLLFFTLLLSQVLVKWYLFFTFFFLFFSSFSLWVLIVTMMIFKCWNDWRLNLFLSFARKRSRRILEFLLSSFSSLFLFLIVKHKTGLSNRQTVSDRERERESRFFIAFTMLGIGRLTF